MRQARRFAKLIVSVVVVVVVITATFWESEQSQRRRRRKKKMPYFSIWLEPPAGHPTEAVIRRLAQVFGAEPIYLAV